MPLLDRGSREVVAHIAVSCHNKMASSCSVSRYACPSPAISAILRCTLRSSAMSASAMSLATFLVEGRLRLRASSPQQAWTRGAG